MQQNKQAEKEQSTNSGKTSGDQSTQQKQGMTAGQQQGQQQGKQDSSQAEQTLKNPSPENMANAQNEQVKDQVTGRNNTSNNDGAAMDPSSATEMQGSTGDRKQDNAQKTNTASSKDQQQNKNTDSADSMGSGRRQDDN